MIPARCDWWWLPVLLAGVRSAGGRPGGRWRWPRPGRPKWPLGCWTCRVGPVRARRPACTPLTGSSRLSEAGLRPRLSSRLSMTPRGCLSPRSSHLSVSRCSHRSRGAGSRHYTFRPCISEARARRRHICKQLFTDVLLSASQCLQTLPTASVSPELYVALDSRHELDIERH